MKYNFSNKGLLSIAMCLAVAASFSIPLSIAAEAHATEGRHVVHFGANTHKGQPMKGFRKEISVQPSRVAKPVANSQPGFGQSDEDSPKDISKPGDFSFKFHYKQKDRFAFLSKYHRNMTVSRVNNESSVSIHMAGDGANRKSAVVGLRWHVK